MCAVLSRGPNRDQMFTSNAKIITHCRTSHALYDEDDIGDNDNDDEDDDDDVLTQKIAYLPEVYLG